MATLFEKATIISYDEGSRSLKTLRNASLLVENGRISQLVEGDISAPNAEIVNAAGKIISPGFIDTHHHMWQSAFRTLGPNTTLSEYFAGRHMQLGPASKHFTPEDIYLGQMACALELIDGGTTTVLDHAHAVFSNDHIDEAVKASFESGLRIFFAHTIQPIGGYTTEMGIKKLVELSKDSRFGLVELGVAYDGWGYASTEANEKFMDLVNGLNLSVLTSHMVGGPYGANNSPTFVESSKIPVVLSHASMLSYNDARVLRAHPNLSLSTTPESEAHYGHTSIGADLCQNCSSLGVDSHFTFSSYMPFQARFWLQSLRDKLYKEVVKNWEVPANNPMECDAAFLLMTQKGGEALGRKDLGVINVGAQADLVVIDTKRPALWGVDDPVAAVVLHSSVADVESVMVQGKWLKKDHQILGKGGVKERFEESAKRIQKIWEGIPLDVLEEGEVTWSGAKYAKTKVVNVKRNW